MPNTTGLTSPTAHDHEADYTTHRAEALRLGGQRGAWYEAEFEDVPGVLARANMHATLALAAATAMKAGA